MGPFFFFGNPNLYPMCVSNDALSPWSSWPWNKGGHPGLATQFGRQHRDVEKVLFARALFRGPDHTHDVS
jgi:hypothetical protein